MKGRNENKIDEHSLTMANKLFGKDLSQFYLGHILTDLDKQRYIYKGTKKLVNTNFQNKTKKHFTLFNKKEKEKEKEKENKMQKCK